MEHTITKRIELHAPIARVWRALTDYREFGEWFRVKLDGPFVVGQIAHGRITYPGYEHLSFDVLVQHMEHERLFAFRWHHNMTDTHVDFSKEPTTLVEFRLDATAHGTVLTIIESGFENLPADRRGDAFRENEGGWTIQMDNIKHYVSAHVASATSFLKLVAERKVQEAYDKFISPEFIHHNQYFKGDRQSLMTGMEEAGRTNPNKQLEIRKVFEDGDTVITLSHVKQKPDEVGGAVVHIFRFDNHRVVELWDLGQPILKDSINEHGVF